MSTVDNTNIVGTKTGPELVTELQTQIGNADTELEARPETAGTESISGDWTFEAEVIFEAGLAIIGNVSITTGDLVMAEKADHTSTPAAGYGYLWVKDTEPCGLWFTNDAGTDFQLGVTGSGDILANGTIPMTANWDFGGYGLHNFSAVFNNQTGTTYTIQASDNGKILTFNNASAIAVTLPDTLADNFQCTIVQVGAGVPTVTRSGTDTINGAATGVAPSAQWKGMYLSQYSSGAWLALL